MDHTADGDELAWVTNGEIKIKKTGDGLRDGSMLSWWAYQLIGPAKGQNRAIFTIYKLKVTKHQTSTSSHVDLCYVPLLTLHWYITCVYISGVSTQGVSIQCFMNQYENKALYLCTCDYVRGRRYAMNWWAVIYRWHNFVGNWSMCSAKGMIFNQTTVCTACRKNS